MFSPQRQELKLLPWPSVHGSYCRVVFYTPVSVSIKKRTEKPLGNIRKASRNTPILGGFSEFTAETHIDRGGSLSFDQVALQSLEASERQRDEMKMQSSLPSQALWRSRKLNRM